MPTPDPRHLADIELVLKALVHLEPARALIVVQDVGVACTLGLQLGLDMPGVLELHEQIRQEGD